METLEGKPFLHGSIWQNEDDLLSKYISHFVILSLCSKTRSDYLRFFNMSPHNTSVFMLSNISAVASMSGASTYSLLYSLHISTTILLDSSPGKNFIPDRHLICLKITGTISKRCCKEAPQQPKATSVLSGYISERCDTEAPQPTKYASISAAEKGNDTKTVLAHLPRLLSYS